MLSNIGIGNVGFQMSPQISSTPYCIVTLAASAGLFSVHLKCLFKFSRWRCIITLVAFVWFSPLCIFKCFLNEFVWKDAKSHWPHLNDFFPVCIFMCILKSLAWTDAYSHWGHLFDFSTKCVFKCILKALTWTDAKSHWLHFCFYPSVYFYVHPQSICLKWCIFKLGAFI